MSVAMRPQRFSSLQTGKVCHNVHLVDIDKLLTAADPQASVAHNAAAPILVHFVRSSTVVCCVLCGCGVFWLCRSSVCFGAKEHSNPPVPP